MVVKSLNLFYFQMKRFEKLVFARVKKTRMQQSVVPEKRDFNILMRKKNVFSLHFSDLVLDVSQVHWNEELKISPEDADLRGMKENNAPDCPTRRLFSSARILVATRRRSVG